jgi:hypothetical protein
MSKRRAKPIPKVASRSQKTQSQKDKARWARIKRVYNLEREDYEELALEHCPLCLRRWSDSVRPAVDHDHKSGFVRGILCLYCNRYVLGRLSDPEVALRIYTYLVNQPKKHIVPPKPKRKRRRKAR